MSMAASPQRLAVVPIVPSQLRTSWGTVGFMVVIHGLGACRTLRCY